MRVAIAYAIQITPRRQSPVRKYATPAHPSPSIVTAIDPYVILSIGKV